MRALLASVLGLCAGAAGGLALGNAWTLHQVRALEATTAALREAQERVGAACEPVFMAAWPDGGCAARFTWPPVACAVGVYVYRHPDKGRVLARVRELGPRFGLTFIEERGARERFVPLSWSPEVPR